MFFLYYGINLYKNVFFYLIVWSEMFELIMSWFNINIYYNV